ncbi:hypothetical protein SHKM778_43520 [Streptomyces sp. KM77-8]|uniref:Fe/B12 periplasmic-binding domain-containing protein n=1 Tax=Streptomyces haneummycinicus TaxID=3074435 RepID=A0AAT9HKY2_9ACTN
MGYGLPALGQGRSGQRTSKGIPDAPPQNDAYGTMAASGGDRVRGDARRRALAGCGSDSDASDKAAGTGSTAAAGAFPVTVEHAFGSTTVDKAPERVVTVGYTDDQTVLAFGVKPVGMTDQYPNPTGQSPDINTQWPWVKDKWGDTKPEVIMKNGDAGPNYEKIAALRPDLIIAVYSEIDRAGYDKLSRIAPTVGRTKAEKELFSAPWQDNALHIAKALGRAEDGAKMVEDIEGKLETAKKDHPEFAGQSAVALSWYENSVAPFTSTDVRGRLLSGIGFTYQTKIDDIAGGSFYTKLSPSASTSSTSTTSSSSTTRRTPRR